MNYYVKGDAANAGKINAAFEKLGIDVLDFGFADKAVVYCSIGECVQYLPYSINLMHILYSHPDYKELELAVKPKFNVGDRVIYKGNVCTITFMDEAYYDFDGGVAGCRIELQDELLSAAPKFKVGDWIISVHPDAIFKVGDVKKTTYKLIDIYGDGYDCQITEIDKNYHLWSIADAKYGDVFANTAGCILIAKDNESCLCYIDKNGGFHADNNKWFFVDFSDNALTPATQEQRGLLFAKMKEEGYEWDAGKKELRKTIEPTFKVGDWVVTDYGKVSQVVSVDNAGDGYTLDDGVYFSGSWCDMYHLWTIADAKDGDVLSSIRGCPFIYDKYRNQRNDLLYYYAGIDGRGNFVMKCPKRMLYHFGPSTDAAPATKEQRDLLFAKMKEEGYEWDADKKELKKIQSHYDIANFHAGMPVLVRDYDNSRWSYVQFSHYVGECRMKFNACGIPYIQCVPFNDDTKHLLGTTEPCDEQYINW
jgi:hypothetical protein